MKAHFFTWKDVSKALALKTRAAANLLRSKGLAPPFFNDLDGSAFF